MKAWQENNALKYEKSCQRDTGSQLKGKQCSREIKSKNVFRECQLINPND